VVEITSPFFWVKPVSIEQQEKFNIIKTKREEGLTFREISDYLNSSMYKPQRTDKFTPQQVFGLYDKMKKRIIRLNKCHQLKFLHIGIVCP